MQERRRVSSGLADGDGHRFHPSPSQLLIFLLHHGGRALPLSRRHVSAAVWFFRRRFGAQRRSRAQGRGLRLPGNGAGDHAGEILRSMVTKLDSFVRVAVGHFTEILTGLNCETAIFARFSLCF